MTLRVAAVAALFLAAVGCGGNTDTPAPAATDSRTAASGATAPSSGVEVIGKLAPSLAPPSTFIALESQDGEVPIKSEPAVMDQVTLMFLPAFLVAQAGQRVEFRNSEDVLHNIRVTEASEQKPVFNVATPPFGKYAYTFEKPGVYTVGCDIHQTMRADILVTATPYTATAGDDGSFAIANVRPGKYELKVYAGGDPVVRTIDVTSGKTDLGVIQ
jgi:plastocyanin